MPFTLEEAYRETKDIYDIQLVAGANGMHNTISWVYQLEDTTIIDHFWGKELVVTLGVGFQQPGQLFNLVKQLIHQNVSGLLINTGRYIHEISEDVLAYCNEHSFPLLTIPWEIVLADLIKDFCIRAFNVEDEDRMISKAFITAIESPGKIGTLFQNLSESIDLEGTFQAAMITGNFANDIVSMHRRRLLFEVRDLFDRKNLACHIFWYNDAYLLISNNTESEFFEETIHTLLESYTRQIPNMHLFIGIGNVITGIESLSQTYQRAHAALKMCHFSDTQIYRFEDMGIYQLLFSIDDTSLLTNMYENTLECLRNFDSKHNASYEETLYYYIKFNGSIQQISDAMYTHRNTVMYRIKKIKELLHNDLETPQDRFPFEIAFYIKEILDKDIL